MGNYVNISVSRGVCGAVPWRGQAAWQISFQERGLFLGSSNPPGGSQKVTRGTTHMKMLPSVYTRPIFSKYFSTQPIKNCAGSPFCDELKVWVKEREWQKKKKIEVAEERATSTDTSTKNQASQDDVLTTSLAIASVFAALRVGPWSQFFLHTKHGAKEWASVVVQTRPIDAETLSRLESVEIEANTKTF